MNRSIKLLASALAVAAVMCVVSCKKVLNSSDAPTYPADTTTAIINLDSLALVNLLDSVYMYAHQLYFWNGYIPSYAQFNPSQYAVTSNPDSINLQNELFAFTVTYNSAINPVTGKSYEYYPADAAAGGLPGPKYSYFEDNTTYSATSAIANATSYLNGVDYGFGYYPGIWDDTTLLVRYVENGSPFYQNGIQRGDKILSINGTVMNFATNNTAAINVVNATLSFSNTSNANFQIQQIRNNDTDTVSININPVYFNYNPIFKDTIVTAGSEQVGYIAYQSFTYWQTNSSSVLQNIFTTFANTPINDLVIDLRYNGGGYIETSQNFANLVAPNSANGKTMFIEYYNDTMTSGNATLLANQGQPVSGNYWSAANNIYAFSKLGSLGSLSRVFFLVSDNTASAAELLINNLKPYMNVVLIGTQWEAGSGNNTYGKPVGFFPINIGKYVYYFPEFASGNATDPVGGASYYNGISVNNASTDDARYDFGNPNETAFAQALYYITNGSFNPNYDAGNVTGTSSLRNMPNTITPKRAFKQSGFTGMLHNTTLKIRQ